MAIQFWIYIGSFLISSIALAVLVKSLAEGFAAGGKKPFVYGSISGIVMSVVAYFTTLLTQNAFTVFWLLGAVFLLFGILNLVFTHARYFYAYKENVNRVLLGEVLFSLSIILFTIVVFSSLQYVLKNFFFLFYPVLVSTLLFFVPLFVFHAFQAASRIPAAEFHTWYYPVHDPIELPDSHSNEKILVIGFEIAKNAPDPAKTYFRAKAPETMKLGDLFYHFINDYNDLHSETRIRYLDKDAEPYEWWFRRKPKWYEAQKILNPELSVRENGLKENAVIICERVTSKSTVSTLQ